ncbi:hypothetical protein F5Y16DRAFT_88585 [Xylariaceae sp. FL0255]|nr:hypothetical protein F5Y16DRAFT_88585 [Xylariaceae sp. FL0255]
MSVTDSSTREILRAVQSSRNSPRSSIRSGFSSNQDNGSGPRPTPPTLSFMTQAFGAPGPRGISIGSQNKSLPSSNCFNPRLPGAFRPQLSLSSPNQGPGRPTGFVMKRALHSTGERSIETEIEALRRLQGSMHIAQPSVLLDDPRFSQAISGLSGPALVMEWIEHGLLYNLLERRGDVDEPLPNRVLWCLFLCCKFSHTLSLGTS